MMDADDELKCVSFLILAESSGASQPRKVSFFENLELCGLLPFPTLASLGCGIPKGIHTIS